MSEKTSFRTNPAVARALMIATYAIGGAGYVIAFAVDVVDAVKWVCLLSVGVVGVISMVRHSIFHRADAARMGWDLGKTNNFQIETGFANGAMGVVALLAVFGDWGTVAQAAIIAVYALYFAQVSVLVITGPDRTPGRIFAIVSQTLILAWFAFEGLRHMGMSPFG